MVENVIAVIILGHGQNEVMDKRSWSNSEAFEF